MKSTSFERRLEKTKKVFAKMKTEKTVSSEEEMMSSLHRSNARKALFIVVCVAIAFVVAGLSITIGTYSVDFWTVYETIWNRIIGNVQNTRVDHIVVNLRLPRILLGIIAGAGLAIAGAVMQGVLKNPLADPYTTGISSGASLGATLAMTAGISFLSGQFALIGNAFVFSLIPVLVIIFVSRLKGGASVTMILSGLAVMYFFNAMTMLMMLRADPDDVAAVYQWQVGTLSTASWSSIPVALTVLVFGTVVLCYLSSKINILSSGDDNATTLGVNVSRLRTACLLLVSLISASIVAFTGIIGFVGLVCPHIVRMFIGNDNRYLLPASAAFGATFLLVCDFIGRTALPSGSIHVGVVTAFIGGPMFLYLILRQKKVAE